MIKNYILIPVYFDYSSTTPVDPRVIEKILPYFYYKFGNYNSRSHIFGWQTEYVIENSRKKISKFLNCNSRELIFTSSVTESNNLSIKGVSFFYKNKGNHIITLKTEHKSILETCNSLIKDGYNVTFLNIKNNGLLNIDIFENYFKKDTILVSILYVNNEIGVLQNIKKISIICKKKKVILHIDGSQANCKLFIDLNLINIDMLSLSSHKSYGPKGISILYIRRKSNIFIKTQIDGGGHEKNLRSSTLPTHLIVGVGEIYFISNYEFSFNNLKIKNFKNLLFFELLKVDSLYLNGDYKYRLPNNLNFSFNFIEGESLIISLKNFALSTGSACASNNLNFSYVIKNIRNNYSLVHSSIRLTFGKFNILNDLYYIIINIIKNVMKLRLVSPLFII